MGKIKILLIDDEQSQLISLKSFLSKRNYEVLTAENGLKGFDIIKSDIISIVISDYKMPEWDGLKTLRMIKDFNPAIDVVICTAFGSIDDAVKIMKAGAYDYLTKPINLDELENLICRISEKQQLQKENKILKEQLQEKFSFSGIITQNEKMEQALNLAGRAAQSASSIMIRGESGTGKELIAKAIHYASNRANKPFIIVNAASLSENLLESELFGHEKGSFTGAINQRSGRFEDADGGTLFIDELGDIPLQVQVKLLRAIQFGEIQRIGSSSVIKVNVRILSATHRNIEEMIAGKLFREDLYYRLNVITINLPPLRDRKSDIPLLVEHFIKKHSQKNDKKIEGITKQSLDILMRYNYPGNIRELENMIERAVVLSRNNEITPEYLPITMVAKSNETIFDPYNLEEGFEKKVKSFERAIIEEAINRNNGNKSAAARLLGISERHIRSIIERLDIKE
ncbi:MAG: sigma-54-dependent Fis family transcriptional regulator [Ignavibacteria bacterium]|nr:sigma-54-dependent Fis family transcriptional regulator [Ignavibacteria bacterium]